MCVCVRALGREDGAYLACEYTERFDQSCHRRLLRVSAGEEMQTNVSICIYSNTWGKTYASQMLSSVYSNKAQTTPPQLQERKSAIFFFLINGHIFLCSLKPPAI